MERHEGYSVIDEESAEAPHSEQFIEQLYQGEQLLRQIAEIPQDTNIELSSEQKILFSMFTIPTEGPQGNGHSSDSSRSTPEKANVGITGLQVDEKLYPFADEYRAKTHEAVTTYFAEESATPDELFEKLALEDSKWQKHYSELSHDKFATQISLQYEQKAEQAKVEFNAQFSWNTLWKYREAIIFENGADQNLSPEARKSLHSDIAQYKRRYNAQVAEYKAAITRLKKEKKAQEQQRIDTADITSRIQDATRDSNEGAKTLSENFNKAVNIKFGTNIDIFSVNKEASSRWLKDLNKFIIDRGYLSAQELDAYYNFNNDRATVVESIRQAFVDDNDEQGEHTFNERLNILRNSIKENCGAKYLESLEDRPLLINYEHYERRRESVITEPESHSFIDYRNLPARRSDLLRYLHQTPVTENLDTEDIILKYEELCYKYYFKLLPNYLTGKAYWGPPPISAKAELEDTLVQIKKDCNSAIAKEAPALIQRDIEALKTKISSTFAKDVADIYILPTGIILRKNDNTGTSIAVSPLDSRLQENMTETERQKWGKIWESYQSQDMHEFDPAMRRYINREIVSIMSNNESGLSSSEQELLQLKKDYSFIINNDILNEATGDINVILDDYDTQVLAEIMPHFGGFIDVVEKSTTQNNISAQNIREQIKRYLSGLGSGESFLVHSKKQKINLNLSEFEKISNSTEDDNSSSAASLLSACLAVNIFANLDKETTDEFSQLIDDQATVSKMTFFKVYGRKIESIVERRQLATRTFFVAEFGKYIRKESTPEITNFFDKLKQSKSN